MLVFRKSFSFWNSLVPGLPVNCVYNNLSHVILAADRKIRDNNSSFIVLQRGFLPTFQVALRLLNHIKLDRSKGKRDCWQVKMMRHLIDFSVVYSHYLKETQFKNFREKKIWRLRLWRKHWYCISIINGFRACHCFCHNSYVLLPNTWTTPAEMVGGCTLIS